MTGYRRGDKVRCGKDRTGYKLFARSAIQCARKGYGWQQILRTYYGPRLTLVGGGGGSMSAQSSYVFASDSARAANSIRSAETGLTTRSARTPIRHEQPMTGGPADASRLPGIALSQVTSSSFAAGGRAGGVGAALTSGEQLIP